MVSIIGVYSWPRAVRDQPAGSEPNGRVVYFSRLHSMAEAAHRQSIAGAVIELRMPCESDNAIVRQIGAEVPTAIRLSTNPAGWGQLMHRIGLHSHMFFADERAESVSDLMWVLLRCPGSRGAQQLALECFEYPMPSSVGSLLHRALLLTHQRTSVTRLAAICGLATRTVEWRLSTSGYPKARAVLGLLTSLHALWQIDVLGMTLKRAAASTGFESAASLSDFIQRHVGMRPLIACECGGASVAAALLAHMVKESGAQTGPTDHCQARLPRPNSRGPRGDTRTAISSPPLHVH
jgi:hypothetical protein